MSRQRPLVALEAALHAQGVDAASIPTASALLGLAHMRGWGKNDLAAPVAWLEETACEVLQVPRFSTQPRRSASPEPAPSSPTLDKLQERLQANGVEAEPRRVAAAILGLALENEWNRNPVGMVEWVEQLTVELGQSAPRREQ